MLIETQVVIHICYVYWLDVKVESEFANFLLISFSSI